MWILKRSRVSLWALGALACAALPGAYAAGLRDKLKGLVYEVEDHTEPKDAWVENRDLANKWNLWSTEEDVINKRSGGRALHSPAVSKERAAPEEGAPPLHTRIANIPPGVYHVFQSPPQRPMAVSLDGKTWEKRTGGEVDWGVWNLKDGVFELWVDDRYPSPDNPGPCYYDYLRFEPFVPPKFTHFASFLLADGRVQLSWITDQPIDTGTVEWGSGEKLDHEAPSDERGLRNHRVFIEGMRVGAPYRAKIRQGKGQGSFYSPTFTFTVQPAYRTQKTKPMSVALSVAEPTDAGRTAWPVTSGIPFPTGALWLPPKTTCGEAGVLLRGNDGKAVPAAFTPEQYWPDGSVRWLRVDFLADTRPGSTTTLRLVTGGKPTSRRPTMSRVSVTDKADGITVDNGLLSVRVSRESFALFDSVTVNGQTVTGEPMVGNGRIDDEQGNVLGLGRPDRVEAEEAGPIRAVVRVEGDFVSPKTGGKLMRYRARYFVYALQPFVRLQWTIGNNRTDQVMTSLKFAGLRIPIGGDAGRGTGSTGPGLEGSINGVAFGPVKADPPIELLQDNDNHFRLTGLGQPVEGEHALSVAVVRNDRWQITACVKDFWQTYPKGLALKPDGLHIRLLPVLPKDIYAKESQDPELLIRLYYWNREGLYQVKRGLEFTSDITVFFQKRSVRNDRGDDRGTTKQAWVQNPLFAEATPQAYSDSGVFGRVDPRVKGQFEDYENLVERGFEQIEKNRNARREYGWMNYGDWHGERHFNWGNSEYDLQGTLALAFARTGDLKYLWRADQMATHFTDVDSIHYPWSPRMPGLVYAHSVGHVGGFFSNTDTRFQTFGNVFGLRSASDRNPFVDGVVDPGGHVFEPGDFLMAALMGERRYGEVAEEVVAAQAAYMTPRFDFGIERAAGWPLLNALMAYEATLNPFYLNAARLYVEKIVSKQDKEIGDWRLGYGPPECLHTPPHIGGKAFAVGILLHGLMMYDLIEPSPEVKDCIVRAARWLERDSWNHETHAFRYISTCPTFDRPRGNGSTDFTVTSGLAYAVTLSRDPKLKALLLDSLSRALKSGVGAGKDYAMDIRQTPYALYILKHDLGLTELPPVYEEPSLTFRGMLRAPEGRLTIYVTHSMKEPVAVKASVTDVPAGWSAGPNEASLQARAGTSAMPPITFKGQGEGTAHLSVHLGDKVTRTLEVAFRAVLPESTFNPLGQSGVAILGPPDNPTCRALAQMEGITVSASLDVLPRCRAAMLGADCFAKWDQRPEEVWPKLTDFVRAGGKLVLWQLNDENWKLGYLPFDLVASDQNGEARRVLKPEHPLFKGISSLGQAVCYDTFAAAGPEWTVLATDDAGGPCILEANYGKGSILIIEPSFDRYACSAEQPPKELSVDTCKRFVANVLSWVQYPPLR